MDGIVNFLSVMGNLKRLPRTGWLLRGIHGGETVAAHNHRVALICMILCDRIGEADFEKTLKMALMHEMGETRLGDIPTPAGRLFDKDRIEKMLSDELLDQSKLDCYKPLMNEYFFGESLEKRIVEAADKLDMLLQAREYYREGYQGAAEFFGKVDDFIEKFSDIEEISGLFIEIKNGFKE